MTGIARSLSTTRTLLAPHTMTVREAINTAIDEEMTRDPTVFIMGSILYDVDLSLVRHIIVFVCSFR